METGGIGREIKASRARAGMSQQELADATGVSINSISNYERGNRKSVPPRDWIENAERVLGARLLEAAGYLRARPGVEDELRDLFGGVIERILDICEQGRVTPDK